MPHTIRPAAIDDSAALSRLAATTFRETFENDDANWTWNSRHVHEALPDSEGMFSMDSLLPGDYYAVAVDALHRGQALNADFLKEVEGAATRIAVKAHETTPISLPLTPVGAR